METVGLTLIAITAAIFLVMAISDRIKHHEANKPADKLCNLKGGSLSCFNCPKNQTCIDCLPLDMPVVEEND